MFVLNGQPPQIKVNGIFGIPVFENYCVKWYTLKKPYDTVYKKTVFNDIPKKL